MSGHSGAGFGCESCNNIDTQTDGKRLCLNGTLEPTLPDWARTMNVGVNSGSHDLWRYHPWRAPGHAPVNDPCGMAGGTIPANAGGTPDAVFTNTSLARMGELGSHVLPYAPSGTIWFSGSTVEVGWGITYNHGETIATHAV